MNIMYIHKYANINKYVYIYIHIKVANVASVHSKQGGSKMALTIWGRHLLRGKLFVSGSVYQLQGC